MKKYEEPNITLIQFVRQDCICSTSSGIFTDAVNINGGEGDFFED